MSGNFNNELIFNWDVINGRINYTKKTDLAGGSDWMRWRSEYNMFLNHLIHPAELYHNSVACSELDDLDVFKHVPNLCVNLVNYINAHNVTVIKRERDVDIDAERVWDGEREKNPFYLVTIRDGVVEEPELPTGRTWDLKWRVYVRGHDRKYRDDQRRVVRTTWIGPHIKGPDGAPWRYQRYQVLATKLLREKEMLREHGVE